MYHYWNYQQPLPTAYLMHYIAITKMQIKIKPHFQIVCIKLKLISIMSLLHKCEKHVWVIQMHNAKGFIEYKFDTAVCIVNIAMCKLNYILLAPFPKNSRPNSQAVIRIYVWHLEILNISDWHDIYYVFKRILSILEMLLLDRRSCKGTPLGIKQFCKSVAIILF